MATLAPFNKKPLPALPYHISINSVLAILALIIKSCNILTLAEGLSQLKWEYFKTPQQIRYMIAYDAASRGPWGCIRLVFSSHGSSIATFGALISVLVLVIDPFVQQLITYYPCDTTITNGTRASLPRSSLYNDRGRRAGAGLYEISPNLRTAIYSGLVTSNLLPSPVSCPTGNCTFDGTYATLGFYSECEDVSQELYMERTMIERINSDTKQPYNASAFITSLPSGSFAWTAGQEYSDDQPFTITNRLDDPSTFEVILAAISSAEPRLYTPAHYWSLIQPSCQVGWQNNTWGCVGYGAARCTLKPCVKVMQAKLELGVLREEVIETFVDLFTGSPYGTDLDVNPFSQMVMADTTCLSNATKHYLSEHGFVTNGSRFIPYPMAVDTYSYNNYTQLWNDDTPGSELSLEVLSQVPHSCIYQIESVVLDGLHKGWKDIFDGALQVYGDGLRGEIVHFQFFNNTYVNVDSVAKLFSSIAEAITIQIRSWDADGKSTYNQPMLGNVHINDTCMKVRWPWIVYPIAISAATFWFLLIVLVRTERKESSLTRGWKSSPLPFLYGRIDLTGRNEDRIQIDSMKRASKTELGQLQSTSIVRS